MAKPSRNARPDSVPNSARTFFATTKTSQGQYLLQSERNATLLIDVLRSCVAAGKFRVHDFVVMPDHVHVLVTVGSGMTIEKAMQFLKGGFSYRLRKEYGYLGRSLAARVFRNARGGPRELRAASGIRCGEPGEGGSGRLPGGVPLLLCVLGKAKSDRG